MSGGEFRAVHSTGAGWAEAASSCADALLPLPDGASLGFLYATEALADDLGSILTFLRERTRVEHWVGSVGLGVCGAGQEYFQVPAVSALVTCWPDSAFRVFGPQTAGAKGVAASEAEWFTRTHPAFGVVHGDPRDGRVVQAVASLSAQGGLYLVGGLAASSSAPPRQIAERVVEGGLSGVVLSPDITVATGLTQGCSPIGPARRVTEARENIVMEIDDRPALEVFKEDIGELLSRDLRKVAGRIFAGIPVRGSDTGDYLVRNLVGLDLERGWLAVGEKVEPRRPILFCRRDRAAAEADLAAMAKRVRARVGQVRGGVYVSCLARGPNTFESAEAEVAILQQALGDVPLVGFYANGEISHDRIYGYTGVLALF